ncbi:MAG TPA: Ig-like domain-containing protein, partial [Myxococcaceae bacterium]|nr:Ig-like domain-containing protein [Myxococcaceae bacterium]
MGFRGSWAGWALLACLGLGCAPTYGDGVTVGRSGEAPPRPPPEAELETSRPRAARPPAPDRGLAAGAWRLKPGEESALGLARAYFPELAPEPPKATAPGAWKASLDPVTALAVTPPATADGALRVATRGHVFEVRALDAAAAPVRTRDGGSAFAGPRHFWTAVGGAGLTRAGHWLTQRVEEYEILEGGGAPYSRTYEVRLPDGIQALRDAGGYLELLDGHDVPVARFHYAVARDAAGRSRQGTAKVWGAEPDGTQGGLPRLAPRGRSLRLQLTVALDGLEGPVVVDPGWSATGEMSVYRDSHSVTLLPSGKVLAAGGSSQSHRLYSAELYDPATGTWSATGSMMRPDVGATIVLPTGKVLALGSLPQLYDPATGTWGYPATTRYFSDNPTATLLPSGEVLVAGGSGTDCYLYDPANETWRATGSLTYVPAGHTATLLSSGKVLVAGGGGRQAALYDPVAGRWSSAGSMVTARESHIAMRLPSGKVLVAGGGACLRQAELYDPIAGTWSSTGPLATGHCSGAAVQLPSGKVLMMGGLDGNSILQTTELYDPETGTWSSAGAMVNPRAWFAATLLPSGKALAVGGSAGTSVELYDPAAGTWSATGALSNARRGHTATLLPSGRVLVAGGVTTGLAPVAGAELYEPQAGTWSVTASMSIARDGHTATLLPSGKVLVAGGSGPNGSLGSAELYDPATGTWSQARPMVAARERHSATLLPSGKVLVAGGTTPRSPARTELYDPATDSWSSAGSLLTGRRSQTATLLPSGKVLVAGGISDDNAALASAELYDPAAGTWRAAGSQAGVRSGHTATLLPSGKVLVAGGMGGPSGNPLSSAELYDPVTGTWSAAGPMVLPRGEHTATLLPTGKVLVVGSGPSAELYDPAVGTWSSTAGVGALRTEHTATPLPSGRVLVAGGSGASGPLASAEVYEDTGGLDSWRPLVAPAGTLEPGTAVTITGRGFTGGSEVSSGGRSAATNFPVLTLSRMEGEPLLKLPFTDFSSTAVTMNLPVLPQGYYLLSVITNAMPGGAVVRLLDSLGPSAPVISAPEHGTVVAVARPLIHGTVEAGATVLIDLDGALAGTVVADSLGSWSFVPVDELAQGPHTLTVRGRDAIGNLGPPSARVFTVDTIAPEPPVVRVPASGALVGTATPLLSGTSEPDSAVTVTLDGAVQPAVRADVAGAWRFQVTASLGEGAHTVTARASDVAGYTSPYSAVVFFTVDLRAPAAPWVLVPASGAFVATVTPTFSGTAEARATVTLSIDGESAGTAVVDIDGTWRITPRTALGQGGHTAVARATDPAGNVGPNSGTTSLTVDTVVPRAPEVTTPASGALVSVSTPLISGTAEAGTTVTVFRSGTTVIGTAVVDAAGSWGFTPPSALVDGLQTVTAQASDVAGNTSLVSTPRSFTVDALPPDVPLVLAPGDGAQLNTTTPVISGTAEAGSTVTVSVDGTDAGTAAVDETGGWRFTPGSALGQGTHTVRARVTDVGGRTGLASEPRSFNVDLEPPGEPAVLEPISGALLNTATPLIAGTTESGGTVTLSIDGAVVATVPAGFAGSWSFTPGSALRDGSHAVTARATDAAGNVGSVSASRAFTVDTLAPPAPVVMAPAHRALVNESSPPISGTAEPGGTVFVSLDGTTAVGTAIADVGGAWAVRPSAAFRDGLHAVTAWVRDAAGNSGSLSAPRSFVVDTVAPDAPVVVTPASNAVVRTVRPQVTGTAEPGSTVAVSIDGVEEGTAAADGAGNWSFLSVSLLDQGPHTVTAVTTDLGGRSSAASEPRPFYIDSVAPPAPGVLTPADGAFVLMGTSLITGIAEPGSTVTITVDGAVLDTVVANITGIWSSGPSAALAEGAHTVTARAADTVGNAGASSHPRTFTVARAELEVPEVLSPVDGASVTKALVVAGTAAPNSTVLVFVDGGITGTAKVNAAGEWSLAPDVRFGPHELRVQARDAAGRISPYSGPIR